MIKTIHQIFFRFDERTLEDYPLFVESKRAWENMGGWTYTLWNEQAVEAISQEKCPELHATYRSLRYQIQRVDVAKYIIADNCGGLIVDLDILPLCHADAIIPKDCAYLFDRCSRKHVIANDFFYVGSCGLPGILDYFLVNLSRVDSIAVYEVRKMRYILQSSGPDLFTRYLKNKGLDKHRVAISDRTFPHAPGRNTRARDPLISVVHQLSWVKQLSLTKTQMPKLPGRGRAASRGPNAKGTADPAEEACESRVGAQIVGQSVADHERVSSDSASQCDPGGVVPVLLATGDADGPYPECAADGDTDAIPA
jgi:hypothetical protein